MRKWWVFIYIISFIFFPQMARGAEKINFVHSSLIFSISIDSLEHFAKTGEIKPDLKPYPGKLDEKTLTEIRFFLNRNYNFSGVNIRKLTHTSLGQDLLKQLGKIVSTHRHQNGFYALRGSILTTANQKPSWTIIDILRNFPTDAIFVDLELLAQLKDDLFLYQSYRETIVKIIENQADIQKTQYPNLNVENLPDLSQLGKYKTGKEMITISRQDIRQTVQGFVRDYSFDVDVYFPVNYGQKSPLILISHGFGSRKENFASLAEHLASYGFVVAIPEHVGSDLRYRQELLQGGLSSALSPVEYTARPQDLSSIIDKMSELVAESEIWSKRVDLNKIGAIGDSLGGTTVLSVAGAPLNISRLKTECDRNQVIVNASLIVQCQAQYLPPLEYNLHDGRIKAVIATHPLISGIFGAENLSQIKIPIMITAGSNDVITPVVIEQIHPFIWLKSPFKHLLFYNPGTHFSSTKPDKNFTFDSFSDVLIGKNREEKSNYFFGIAVAFMEFYLNNNSEYLAYLTPNYGQFSSPNEFKISQINNLSEQDIISVYGADLPLQIVPPLVVSFPGENEYNSLVEEIKETNVLKVAIPQNQLPFGYLDRDGNWQGYCQIFAEEFASFLEKELNLAYKPNLVFLPTNNEQFSLVKSGNAHLECGGNAIVQNQDKINFSLPFLVTGNFFLIPNKIKEEFNPNQSLEKFRIAVAQNSLSVNTLQTKYPQVKPFFLDLSEAIKALDNNSIDAIIDSRILLESQLLFLNNPQDYQIIPSQPLNCEYYGLVLPKYDQQWQDIVNKFILKSPMTNKYLSPEIEANLLKTLNYCLNVKN